MKGYIMAKVKFMTWDCKTVCGQYKNGNTAIQLVDAVDGEPIATATVNMGEKLERNMAYIKTLTLMYLA